MKSTLTIALSAFALSAVSAQLGASELNPVMPSFIDYSASGAGPSGAASSREAHVFPAPSYLDYAPIGAEQASAGGSAPVVPRPMLDASSPVFPQPSFIDLPAIDPSRVVQTL
jgi:hypothetical protein